MSALIQQIAIDGPAGAGKSSVAKTVAKKLGYLFIDSGAMYRSIAALALRAGLNIDDALGWETIARENPIYLEDNSSVVKAGGYNLTEEIRSPEVTAATKYAAGNPVIRDILVARQREIGSSTSIVMEGRDIGTVVLPEASCKIYLDASSQVRAQRRYDELIRAGKKVDFDEIHALVVERDESDKNRSVGPLKQADDAVYLDTSDMSFAEVVQRIVALAQESIT